MMLLYSVWVENVLVTSHLDIKYLLIYMTIHHPKNKNSSQPVLQFKSVRAGQLWCWSCRLKCVVSNIKFGSSTAETAGGVGRIISL